MNNRLFLYALLIFVFASTAVYAQISGSDGDTQDSRVKRPRIFNDAAAQPTPTPKKVVVITSTLPPVPMPAPTPTPFLPENPAADASTQPEYDNTADATVQRRIFKYGEIRDKINEAKRQMQTKPLRISMLDESQTTDIVRVAFHDYRRDELDFVVLSKEEFLSKSSQVVKISEGGQTVRVQTIRGNGVNTPVIIYDVFNQAHLPLIVQYPIEKYGRFIEMAYYVSTHPGLITPDTVNAGRMYVRNVLDAARGALKQKGIFIQPNVMDMAEKLALVEHVDHQRFRTEYHPKIYNDVYMLYALNQGQTYRYSVSSAGAGGMVQMIPSTYRMIRSRFFTVGLMPDFVEGMRNHMNAAQAMLLYMQMTWNDLIASETVFNAIRDGYATPEQLMAAGYNSNPARLPGYIRRGGAGWTVLIPRETKVYLQILASVERHVPMAPRTE